MWIIFAIACASSTAKTKEAKTVEVLASWTECRNVLLKVTNK